MQRFHPRKHAVVNKLGLDVERTRNQFRLPTDDTDWAAVPRRRQGQTAAHLRCKDSGEDVERCRGQEPIGNGLDRRKD